MTAWRQAIELSIGADVDIVFLLLLPAQPPGDALNALASVARRLRDPESVQRLRHAAHDAELCSAILIGPKWGRPLRRP